MQWFYHTNIGFRRFLGSKNIGIEPQLTMVSYFVYFPFLDQYLHVQNCKCPKDRLCDGFIANILVGIYLLATKNIEIEPKLVTIYIAILISLVKIPKVKNGHVV